MCIGKYHIIRILTIITLSLCVLTANAQRQPVRAHHQTDSIPADTLPNPELTIELGELVHVTEPEDSAAVKFNPYNVWIEREDTFNPDPTRAVWMSALFPGLGQIYNRRYWKLPIIIGGFMGLGYATSWNNTMLTDYSRAYRDLMDNDPDTKSYMDFFPPTTQESDLDKTWLKQVMQSRKNFYRRNRDLCIISMVGVYLLAMVDAYVDASLAHFDVSPDLSLDWAPAVMQDSRGIHPSLGLTCALTF